MLTVGITIMIASIVVGVITLTLAALIVPVGRRRRAAMALEHNPFHIPERDAPRSGAQDDPPRWVLWLTTLSGAGLVLGLLLVMIPSVT